MVLWLLRNEAGMEKRMRYIDIQIISVDSSQMSWELFLVMGRHVNAGVLKMVLETF